MVILQDLDLLAQVEAQGQQPGPEHAAALVAGDAHLLAGQGHGQGLLGRFRLLYGKFLEPFKHWCVPNELPASANCAGQDGLINRLNPFASPILGLAGGAIAVHLQLVALDLVSISLRQLLLQEP